MNAIREVSHISVGVRLLDRDHDDLTEILSEIQFRTAVGLPEGRTSEMLRTLAQRMQLHFALEESMMLATRYPGTAKHRLRHQWLIKQVRTLATKSGRCALERNPHLMNLMTGWHYQHVGDDDLDYGIWLSASGSNSIDSAGGIASFDR